MSRRIEAYLKTPVSSGIPRPETIKSSSVSSDLVRLGKAKLAGYPWVDAVDDEGNRVAIFGKKFAQRWVINHKVQQYIEVDSPFTESCVRFLFFTDGEVWGSVKKNGEYLTEPKEEGIARKPQPRWGTGQIQDSALLALKEHIENMSQPFNVFILEP